MTWVVFPLSGFSALPPHSQSTLYIELWSTPISAFKALHKSTSTSVQASRVLTVSDCYNKFLGPRWSTLPRVPYQQTTLRKLLCSYKCSRVSQPPNTNHIFSICLFLILYSLTYNSFLPSTPVCSSPKGDHLHHAMLNKSLFVPSLLSSLAASLTRHQNWTSTAKAQTIKEKIKWTSSIFQSSAFWETKKWQAKPTDWEHICKTHTSLRKDLDPEFIKNSGSQQ